MTYQRLHELEEEYQKLQDRIIQITKEKQVIAKDLQLCLYLVKAKEWGYDEYDAWVFAAYDKQQAAEMSQQYPNNIEYVRLVGIADESINEPQLILASFNAG